LQLLGFLFILFILIHFIELEEAIRVRWRIDSCRRALGQAHELSSIFGVGDLLGRVVVDSMADQLLLVLPVLLEAQFFFWSMLFLDLVGVDGLRTRDISVDFVHHRVIGVLALIVNPQLGGEDA